MPVVSFGNTSENLNYPIVEPTLDLNFARTKTLDQRISFARSTIGTYVGADGLIKTAGVNEARFDHDPATGESLGLLVEEQRANLLTYSEQFDINWLQGGGVITTIVANDSVAPDSTTTADRATNSSGVGFLYQSLGIANAGTTYTFSVWVKSISNGSISLVLLQTNSQFIGASGFSLQAGVWKRISVTGTVTEGTIISPQIRDITDVYIWGAQLEVGSFPTSYIPTLGTAVTRNPDVVQITGTNFSSWWNDNEITIYTETLKTSYTQFLWKIQNSTRWYALAGPTSFYSELYPFYGGSGNFSAGSGNTSTNKLKMIVSLNNITRTHNGCCNGGNVVIGGYTPTFNNTNIIIGFISDFPGRLNSCLSRMTFYPKQIPNDQLRLLTQ